MLFLFAIVAITLALIFYSFGVWGEKLSKSLKPVHLILFWVGFVCDTTGTTLMGMLEGTGFSFNFHSMTGFVALVLMLVHAIWASVVLARNNEAQKHTFHRLSIAVWIVWLIPYLSGMIMGMTR